MAVYVYCTSTLFQLMMNPERLQALSFDCHSVTKSSIVIPVVTQNYMREFAANFTEFHLRLLSSASRGFKHLKDALRCKFKRTNRVPEHQIQTTSCTGTGGHRMWWWWAVLSGTRLPNAHTVPPRGRCYPRSCWHNGAMIWWPICAWCRSVLACTMTNYEAGHFLQCSSSNKFFRYSYAARSA